MPPSDKLACLHCGAPLSVKPGPGRKPKFCKPAHRLAYNYAHGERERRQKRRLTRIAQHPIEHAYFGSGTNGIDVYCGHCHFLERDHVDGQCPVRMRTGIPLEESAADDAAFSLHPHLAGHGARRSTSQEQWVSPEDWNDCSLELIDVDPVEVCSALANALEEHGLPEAINAVADGFQITREAVAVVARDQIMDAMGEVA